MRSRTLVLVALGSVAVYVLAGWLGGGEGVAVLSGTVPASGAAGMALGLVYALSYFAAVVASPILLVVAASLRLREFLLRPVR